MQDTLFLKGIQKFLNEKIGANLGVDGKFGPKSILALREYQKRCGIAPTGKFDSATSKQCEDLIRGKYLMIDSLRKAAKELEVTVPHINAVMEVEARGSGFFSNGLPAILFERHWFIKIYNQKYPNKAHEIAINHPDIASSKPGGYVGGLKEYDRFNKAREIDLYCAIYSTSFGLFQIMGFNHLKSGYDYIMDFYTAMNESEENHLMAFVKFNQTYRNGILIECLKNKDWKKYAEVYNGPMYAKNQYDKKLEQAFNKHDGK